MIIYYLNNLLRKFIFLACSIISFTDNLVFSLYIESIITDELLAWEIVAWIEVVTLAEVVAWEGEDGEGEAVVFTSFELFDNALIFLLWGKLSTKLFEDKWRLLLSFEVKSSSLMRPSFAISLFLVKISH